MLIPLFPRVAGFKIENFWRRGSRAIVRCTARLSRRLRADETERVERLANTLVEQREVIHECGPDEVEEWHTKLVDALAGAPPLQATPRVAVGERPSRRGPRRLPLAPIRPPDSAA
jgi:hypothetical protein